MRLSAGGCGCGLIQAVGREDGGKQPQVRSRNTSSLELNLMIRPVCIVSVPCTDSPCHHVEMHLCRLTNVYNLLSSRSVIRRQCYTDYCGSPDIAAVTYPLSRTSPSDEFDGGCLWSCMLTIQPIDNVALAVLVWHRCLRELGLLHLVGLTPANFPELREQFQSHFKFHHKAHHSTSFFAVSFEESI